MRRFLLVALGVLLVLAVGCSDNDSGDNGTESATATDSGAPRVEVTEDGSCI